MSVLLLTVARVVWGLDFRFANGALTGGGRKGLGVAREREDEFQLFGSFTLMGYGPVLEFRKRK